MKKFICTALTLAMVVGSLAGCGSSSSKETTAASDNNQTTAESTEAGSTTGEKILKVQSVFRTRPRAETPGSTISRSRPFFP